MSGFQQRLLKGDLSSGKCDSVALEQQLIDEYIGGSGIGARLLFNLLREEISSVNPLEPANPLIFMTGPLSGTTLPSTARMTVNAISPLTGLWGEANVGGYLAHQLKAAGWDGIIILGSASQPISLVINDLDVTMHPGQNIKQSWLSAQCA